jgi:hypothetical protein
VKALALSAALAVLGFILGHFELMIAVLAALAVLLLPGNTLDEGVVRAIALVTVVVFAMIYGGRHGVKLPSF